MLYVGFDLTFVDVIVSIYDASYQNLATKLPELGQHHRYTKIREKAGGNGLNVFRVLRMLNEDVKLVAPLGLKINNLLRQEQIHETEIISIPDTNSNTTIILQLYEGEIQLNATTEFLAGTAWTEQIHNYWQQSNINVSTNWGLNQTAVEWIASQILSANGYRYNELPEPELRFSEVLQLNEMLLTKPFIVDCGLLYSHPEKIKLLQLLKKLTLSQKTYIIGNKEEIPPLRAELLEGNFIMHTKSVVEVTNEELQQKYKVPALSQPIKQTVGAGDAFLAGIVSTLNHSGTISAHGIHQAIRIAQQYISQT